jgi:hypothetical protein
MTTYSIEARVSASQGFATRLTTGAGTAEVRIRNFGGATLAAFPFSPASVTVSEATGQITIAPTTNEVPASATGVPTTAQIVSADGLTLVSAPVVIGPAGLPNTAVITDAVIVAGSPVRLVSLTLG